MKSRLASLLVLGLCCLIADALSSPSPNPKARTGTVRGTAVFVSSTQSGTVQMATNVTLSFADKEGRKTKVRSDDIGDFRVVLDAGSYCVSVFSVAGEELTLAAKQHRCFSVKADADNRIDVMIAPPK